MREVPEDEVPPGPIRLSTDTLEMILVPGNKWYELEAGVDFPTDQSLRKIRARIYGAARRRGGRAAVRFPESGNIMVYATGCSF